jgi:hypothetical protein
VQNEPTADSSPASAGPADGCDDLSEHAAPDPAEMERIRRMSERMERSRTTPEGFLGG